MKTELISVSFKSNLIVRSKKSNAHKGSGQDAPRITENVKQNLQFLRLLRDFQKMKSSTPRPSTSYRKKKAVKQELPEDIDLYQDPTTNLYYTSHGLDTAVPVLLVDGYNVCGYWTKLKKHFIKGRLDIARQKLTDELITFSVLKDVKVVVVFDALMSRLPTHKENFAGVDVVFTGESCADAWIEKEVTSFVLPSEIFWSLLSFFSRHALCKKCGRYTFSMTEVVALKEDGCPKVWVVTSDLYQQQAAHGAGAFVWSCKALVSEIMASQRDFQAILKAQRSTSMQGKLLECNLVPEVVDALKDLKKLLPGD